MIALLVLFCAYKTACCKLCPSCKLRRGRKSNLEQKSFHQSVEQINAKIERLLDHADGPIDTRHRRDFNNSEKLFLTVLGNPQLGTTFLTILSY